MPIHAPLGFTNGSIIENPFSKPIFPKSQDQEPVAFNTSDGEPFETVDNKIFYVKR